MVSKMLKTSKGTLFYLIKQCSECGSGYTFDDGHGDGYDAGGGDNSNDGEVMKVEVQFQQMAFTQSPSLSNNPKILSNYLICTEILLTTMIIVLW